MMHIAHIVFTYGLLVIMLEPMCDLPPSLSGYIRPLSIKGNEKSSDLSLLDRDGYALRKEAVYILF